MVRGYRTVNRRDTDHSDPSVRSILGWALGIPLLLGSAHCTYTEIKMSGGQRAYIDNPYNSHALSVSLSGFDRDKDGNFELIVAEETFFGDDLHPVMVSFPKDIMPGEPNFEYYSSEIKRQNQPKNK